MSRPRLLDLFCCAGGSSVGYSRAGFDVTGVDRVAQPRFPFAFVQADALAYLERHGREFDAVHASPPCQRYTVAARIHDSAARHADLVGPTRELLEATGRPWVIENVWGAPLRRAIMLCGTMFGLRVFRHRWFESSVLLLAPAHGRHNGSTGASDGYSTVARSRGGYVCVAGHNFIFAEGAAAMGIDWMRTRHELAQALPPAFTEYLGRQLLHALTPSPAGD